MTIAQYRASGEQNARFSNRIPKDIVVEPFDIDGIHAEWITPAGRRFKQNRFTPARRRICDRRDQFASSHVRTDGANAEAENSFT